jgi:hypothetical protein
MLTLKLFALAKLRQSKISIGAVSWRLVGYKKEDDKPATLFSISL